MAQYQKRAGRRVDAGDDPEWIQTLLDDVPAPLEPLDVCAVDGFLCAVLLQPRPVPERDWLRFVIDIDGRQPPAGFDAGPLHQALRRRHALLDQAIEQRRWFDPWVFELEDADGQGAVAPASQPVYPWVAGFATALELFPEPMHNDSPAFIEALALLYRHLAPGDLEDAGLLLDEIESLEPVENVADAVEELVRATLLLADVTRPATA